MFRFTEAADLLTLGGRDPQAQAATLWQLHAQHAHQLSSALLLPGLVASGTPDEVLPALEFCLAPARRGTNRTYLPLDRLGAQLRASPWMDRELVDDIEAMARQASLAAEDRAQERSMQVQYVDTDPIWSFRLGFRSASPDVWSTADTWIRYAADDQSATQQANVVTAVPGRPVDRAQIALRCVRDGLEDPQAAPVIRELLTDLPDLLVTLLARTDSHRRLLTPAMELLVALGANP